ncbi:hypothetical protein IACHDJAJ_00135 [Aeromonas phage vB_AdhS_TS3]|nr:hypothetical protein IACHDJAJ_00135 [Aeromonas phage vB_AdhS_TS3]
MRNITEDTVYFNSALPTQYLCGVTFVWQFAKDYGEGEVLETGTSYVPGFYLDNFTQALLHDLFSYEEFPSYEEFVEDHFQERIDLLEQFGFPPVKYIIEENHRYAAKLNMLFAFQLDETMRMREVLING